MPSPSTTIRDLARRVLADQAAHPGRDVAAAIGACEQLRVPLARLTGDIGVTALLSRALVVAKRQDPSLDRLRVGPAGSLEEVDPSRPGPDGGEAVWAGGVLLLAELIGLLVALIGRPLTVGLLRQAWPGTPIPTLSADGEESV